MVRRCLLAVLCAFTLASPAASARTAPRGLGKTIDLAPVTKASGCRTHHGLPDARCTPGADYSRATTQDVCRPGYASAVRNVSQRTKDEVYAEYGDTTHFNGANGEVDHLVSLELGGSNARANLFPEAADPKPGSHEKDKLENRLHSEVCAGSITLQKAQRLIATNWVAAYRARFSASARAAAARTIDLTAKDSGRTISLRKGDRVVVKLAANETTGYHWSTTVRPDRRVVRLTSSRYVPTPTSEPIAGSGGTQVIRLTAAGAGRTRFATAYLSPGTPHTVGRRFRLAFRVR